jgi:hypothetical protein
VIDLKPKYRILEVRNLDRTYFRVDKRILFFWISAKLWINPYNANDTCRIESILDLVTKMVTKRVNWMSGKCIDPLEFNYSTAMAFISALTRPSIPKVQTGDSTKEYTKVVKLFNVNGTEV